MFSRSLTDQPTSAERLAEIKANPGFGAHFTDHMAIIDWDVERGWHDARIVPYGPFTIDPAMMVLHYGQEIFEGLKAFVQPDGSIAAFRPDANAARFIRSARRMALPELPEEMFLASLRELCEVDRQWVPTGEDTSLYLRPVMFASEIAIGVHPAREVTYYLIASPAGLYFSGGGAGVTVWLSTDYVRAAPGGTGEAKTGGNYAASLQAQAEATARGCDQVVWLDATERRWVEEMGTNNLCFVYGSERDGTVEVVTPELNGSILPGITRDSLLTLCRDLGYTTTERRISTDEWAKAAASGEMTEAFGCGTAAVVTPVSTVRGVDGEFTIGDGTAGPVTRRLREALVGIQHGTAPDPHGWRQTLVSAR